MIKTVGYAALSATTPLERWAFERRDVGPHDILIDIEYCGVCHSDIHFARNEWLQTGYPVVPGHEIVGRVAAIGEKVTGWKIGDAAAVGTIVDSCGVCPECKRHLEQYCQQEFTMTFNSVNQHTHEVTYGGYSKNIVVDEKFVLHIPDALQKNLAAVAPLLCAGITVYSPLKHWGVKKGQKVGVIGIGGLGHLAVKIAHALGAHVVAITSTPEKLEDAHRLGADESIVSTDANKLLSKHEDSFDFIINTAPVALDLSLYVPLLKLDGTLCLVGIPSSPHSGLYAHLLIKSSKIGRWFAYRRN